MEITKKVRKQVAGDVKAQTFRPVPLKNKRNISGLMKYL